MKLTCIINDRAGHTNLRAEHGLCFVIESDGHSLLWDTGGSYAVLQHNLRTLGLDSTPFDAVALSHGHNDHTGGLPGYLKEHPETTVHGLTTVFRPRFSLRDGIMTPIGFPGDPTELQARAELKLLDTPIELIPGVHTTGTISPRPYPMGSSERHHAEIDGQVVQDTYADDMSLVLDLGDTIALLCGCCHAGLRNTLMTVRRQYTQPLRYIIGGTHLLAAKIQELEAIADVLQSEAEPELYLNHCSGETAIEYLRDRFGKHVHDCPSGTIIDL